MRNKINTSNDRPMVGDVDDDDRQQWAMQWYLDDADDSWYL
jgi:hypothetical protein